MKTTDVFKAAQTKKKEAENGSKDLLPLEEGEYHMTLAAVLIKDGKNDKGNDIDVLKFLFSFTNGEEPRTIYSQPFTVSFYSKSNLYKTMKKMKLDPDEEENLSEALGKNFRVNISHNEVEGVTYVNAEIMGTSKETGILGPTEIYIKPESWKCYDIAEGFVNKYQPK